MYIEIGASYALCPLGSGKGIEIDITFMDWFFWIEGLTARQPTIRRAKVHFGLACHGHSPQIVTVNDGPSLSGTLSRSRLTPGASAETPSSVRSSKIYVYMQSYARAMKGHY